MENVRFSAGGRHNEERKILHYSSLHFKNPLTLLLCDTFQIIMTHGLMWWEIRSKHGDKQILQSAHLLCVQGLK